MSLLTGGLLQLRRECRYGHGPMEALFGSFALVGLRPLTAAQMLLSDGKVRHPDGRYLALQVWRCPTCAYVEFVDAENA